MTATIPDRNRTATTPEYELGVESFRDQRRAMLREHPEITSWADFYDEQYAAQRKAKLAK